MEPGLCDLCDRRRLGHDRWGPLYALLLHFCLPRLCAIVNLCLVQATSIVANAPGTTSQRRWRKNSSRLMDRDTLICSPYALSFHRLRCRVAARLTPTTPPLSSTYRAREQATLSTLFGWDWACWRIPIVLGVCRTATPFGAGTRPTTRPTAFRSALSVRAPRAATVQ